MGQSYSIFSTLLPLAVFCLGGCGPIKGYKGQDLPLNAVAIVFRDGLMDGLNDVNVDKTFIFYREIAVLPGEHLLTASFATTGPYYNCYSCFDVSTGFKSFCSFTQYSYACQLVARLEAGARYQVKVSSDHNPHTVVLSNPKQEDHSFNCSLSWSFESRDLEIFEWKATIYPSGDDMQCRSYLTQ